MTVEAPSSAPPAAPSARRRSVYSALLVAVGLAIAAVVLLRVARGQWFFADDWEFIARRGVFDGEFSLWSPHNEHWSTIPILVYRALFSLVGLESYRAYLVPLIGVHLGLGVLLWRIMRTSGVQVVIATALTIVFVFLGAGSENLLWAFQLGFVGSFFFGVLAVHLVDRAADRRVMFGAAAASLVVGMMFSSTVLPLVPIAAALASVRSGARAAAIVGEGSRLGSTSSGGCGWAGRGSSIRRRPLAACCSSPSTYGPASSVPSAADRARRSRAADRACARCLAPARGDTHAGERGSRSARARGGAAISARGSNTGVVRHRTSADREIRLPCLGAPVARCRPRDVAVRSREHASSGRRPGPDRVHGCAEP